MVCKHMVSKKTRELVDTLNRAALGVLVEDKTIHLSSSGIDAVCPGWGPGEG